MPIVLRLQGFAVMIFTDDHEPPHVHVHCGGNRREAIVILLGDADKPSSVDVREVVGRFTNREIARALALVMGHQNYLLGRWREIHG